MDQPKVDQPKVDFTALDGMAIELTRRISEITDEVEIVGYEAPPEVVDNMLVYHYHYALQVRGVRVYGCRSRLVIGDYKILLRDIALPPAVMRATSGTVAALEFQDNIRKQLTDPESVLIGLIAYLLRKA